MSLPAKPEASSAPPAVPAPVIERRWYIRWLLRALAWLSLCLGVVGIFVPGLPTTVFILIAGWAAVRSSPAIHAWLWRHPLFSRMLQNWHAGGCVSRRTKRSAAAMMCICAVILWFSPSPIWVRLLSYTCMATVLLWLWRRPEPALNAQQD